MNVTITKLNIIDMEELLGHSGLCPDTYTKDILIHCFSLSDKCWVGRADGELACVWGLIPPTMMSEQAYLWLNTTDVVDDHTFVFVRMAQCYMEKMLEMFPTIVGHCAISQPRAKRWLQWMGARFGVGDGVKVPFTIQKHNRVRIKAEAF